MEPHSDLICGRWTNPLARGIAAIAFGIITLLVPGITLAGIIVAFGVYALFTGVTNIVTSIRHRKVDRRWWIALLMGLLGVGAALVAFLLPGITALSLLFVIAYWALFTGVLEVAMAIRLRKQISGAWMLVLSGVLSVLLAVLLVISPGTGILSLLWLLGAYAIVYGVMLASYGVRLRTRTRQFFVPGPKQRHAPA